MTFRLLQPCVKRGVQRGRGRAPYSVSAVAYMLPFNNTGRERLEPPLRPWWFLFWATPGQDGPPARGAQTSVFGLGKVLLLFLTELRVRPRG